MSDMDAVFAALAVLAKQNQELAEQVDLLKSASRIHSERLEAHGLLLTSSRHKTVQHYVAMAAQARGEAA